MIVTKILVTFLESGNVFLTETENGKETYIVIRNTGDWILIKKLIPEIKYMWWDLKKEGDVIVEVIKGI